MRSLSITRHRHMLGVQVVSNPALGWTILCITDDFGNLIEVNYGKTLFGAFV